MYTKMSPKYGKPNKKKKVRLKTSHTSTNWTKLQTNKQLLKKERKIQRESEREREREGEKIRQTEKGLTGISAADSQLATLGHSRDFNLQRLVPACKQPHKPFRNLDTNKQGRSRGKTNSDPTLNDSTGKKKNKNKKRGRHFQSSDGMA